MTKHLTEGGIFDVCVVLLACYDVAETCNKNTVQIFGIKLLWSVGRDGGGIIVF